MLHSQQKSSGKRRHSADLGTGKDFGYVTEIENRPGGRVILWSKDGYSIIARVIRPLGERDALRGPCSRRQAH